MRLKIDPVTAKINATVHICPAFVYIPLAQKPTNSIPLHLLQRWQIRFYAEIQIVLGTVYCIGRVVLDLAWFHPILFTKKRVGNSLFRSFALSLIRSLLFRSKSLILKSVREQFALVALWKRATMSESLSSLFTKEQIALKNERFVQLLLYFSFVFHCFSPFYAQEWITPVTLRSVNLF